ncbi:hypothetical protein [Flavobacterium sp.]|uniref:hypothetical protein n=1 Tax=Flavobacterium sp. TaxID=239 RepID=UPI003752D417
MIKNIFMALVMLSISNCKSQNNKQQISTQKKDTMDYFDKSKYDKLPIDPKVNYKVLPNGDYVTIDISNNRTVVNILKQNTPYRDYFEYKNDKIKVSAFSFYSIQYGIEKQYDESGKLISEKDLEKDYKFSIENVCELIKKEYGIDLMKNTSNTDTIRYDCNRIKKEIFKGDIRYCYFVSIAYNTEGGASKLIAIDGTTGKILYDIPYEPGFGLDKLPKSKTPIVNPKGIILK